MNQKLPNEVTMAMKNTSVYIPEEDLEAFKKLAKKHNRNVSNMIVVLVREAIEKEKKAK